MLTVYSFHYFITFSKYVVLASVMQSIFSQDLTSFSMPSLLFLFLNQATIHYNTMQYHFVKSTLVKRKVSYSE